MVSNHKYEMTDRDKLEQVAANYNNLIALLSEQKKTTAKMIRGCVFHLKSTSALDRKKAMDSLTELASMLDGEASKMAPKP